MTVTEMITKILLSVSSFSGVLYFFVLANLDVNVKSITLFGVTPFDNFAIRQIAYIIIFSLFALLTLALTRRTFEVGDTLQVVEIKPIESVAVPTYIGLFVIAIGLNQVALPISLIILVVMFLFWVRLERIFYFNPIWLFFGYRFYEVKSDKENTYTLITKRDRLKGKQSLGNLRRLNNYTFLEK
jgi:hypothetical protein